MDDARRRLLRVARTAEAVDAMALHRLAIARGISIAPGPLFSPSGGHQNFIRLNCGYPWSPQIERSIGILGHLVKRLDRA